jgi:hypothetical protein
MLARLQPLNDSPGAPGGTGRLPMLIMLAGAQSAMGPQNLANQGGTSKRS